MAEPKKLEEALKTLKDTICDLTSLEVQTYTGNLDVAVTDQVGSTKFEEILAKVKAGGDLKLVAVTKINFDGDGFVLVPPQALPDHVRQAHEAAVKAGQEVRAGLLALFADMTGLAISKVKP